MTRFIARAMVTTFSLAAAGGAVAQVAPASPPPQAPAAAPQVPLPTLQDTGDSRQTRQRQEVVTVAAMLGAQGREDIQHARVPAAGQVWWRAAVRAHAEATRAAVQPMIWLQGIAGACAVGLAITLVGLAWPALRDLGGQAGALAATAGEQSLLVLIALAAFLLLTPLLLYVALSDE